MDTPLRLAVIVGSTREGRFGPTVARWFAARAALRGDDDLDLVDLADVSLPAMTPAGPDPDVDALIARIAAADCFVVVTPEYNHAYPASLKAAIDLVPPRAWRAKPVGFVSYGGISGGLRAVEQLRQVFPELEATTVRETVSFHGAHQRFGEDGEPHDPAAEVAATKLLDQLAWWAVALRTARAA